MYLTFGYSFAHHGLNAQGATVWFSGGSPDADIAAADYSLTLAISRNPGLTLTIDRGMELSLKIDRALEMTLQK